jgi:peptide/nickel transport system ATP-binding protein/oligopeptide transport system ATP-binding protein
MRLLEVNHLEQRFDVSPGFLERLKFRHGRLRADRTIVHALNGVSFHIDRGEVFGLVGESGCGKSTAAKTVVKIHPPTGGRILVNGEDITAYDYRRMIPIRKRIQMIFQDPYASLNPRQRVCDIVMEPMLFSRAVDTKAAARDRAMDLLRRVGLGPEHAERYPHQFSGGQRQRIGIARALSVDPELVIADEPISALDVSIQAQILNLMMDLKDEFGFSYLFITHNLAVVRHISDRIGVMYLGFLIEVGSSRDIFQRPKHPYTRALLSAAPSIDGEPVADPVEIRGEVGSALSLPAGCCFQPRCPFAFERCAVERPELASVHSSQQVACHLFTGKPQ